MIPAHRFYIISMSLSSFSTGEQHRGLKAQRACLVCTARARTRPASRIRSSIPAVLYVAAIFIKGRRNELSGLTKSRLLQDIFGPVVKPATVL